MELLAGQKGWIQSTTEEQANLLVQQINGCLGLPTEDGRTLTWDIPRCLQNDYSPNETESGYFVIVKNECIECLTQSQKDSIITTLPYTIGCGTPRPITGSTENNL